MKVELYKEKVAGGDINTLIWLDLHKKGEFQEYQHLKKDNFKSYQSKKKVTEQKKYFEDLIELSSADGLIKKITSHRGLLYKWKESVLMTNRFGISMSPVFASLGMKLAQNGSSEEWVVKVSFVQSLTWIESESYKLLRSY